ncbi:hypothetical protein AGMMS50276_19190 [Synergistales bacterium]|nr:hypothetical protein AGMMS50276_19190 [Synergistales bacterium]
MTTATTRGEDVMTDYQFRALLKMVMSILKRNSNEEALKILEDLVEVRSHRKKSDDEDDD